jgi:hypothetical protein
MHTPCPSRVKSSGSGVDRRPSGLPSIADIPQCCRKPPLRAKLQTQAPQQSPWRSPSNVCRPNFNSHSLFVRFHPGLPLS